jgi:hypothetical protein
MERSDGSITHFPPGYKDELLYSRCARLGDLMKFPSHRDLSRYLFGAVVCMQPTLPQRLEALAQRLPAAFQQTAEELLYDGTLYPHFAPVMTRERQQSLRASQYRGNEGSAVGPFGFARERIRRNDLIGCGAVYHAHTMMKGSRRSASRICIGRINYVVSPFVICMVMCYVTFHCRRDSRKRPGFSLLRSCFQVRMSSASQRL